MPVSIIALQMPRNSVGLPTHSLKPVGLPPDKRRRSSTKRNSSSGVAKAVWFGGDMHVTPSGTPRIEAISAVTFLPGITPPRPGLAPWESLIEMHFT